MHKLTHIIAIVMLCCLPVIALALPPALCAWSSGGCDVIVLSSGEAWVMVMGCTDGTGGTWSGTGAWGGDCPTEWIGYPYGYRT